jgi:hypothetical protein
MVVIVVARRRALRFGGGVDSLFAGDCPYKMAPAQAVQSVTNDRTLADLFVLPPQVNQDFIKGGFAPALINELKQNVFFAPSTVAKFLQQFGR